jgi:hypothetical protein
MGFQYQGRANFSSELDGYSALARAGFYRKYNTKKPLMDALEKSYEVAKIPLGSEVAIEKTYHPSRGYEPNAPFRINDLAERWLLRLKEHGSIIINKPHKWVVVEHSVRKSSVEDFKEKTMKKIPKAKFKLGDHVISDDGQRGKIGWVHPYDEFQGTYKYKLSDYDEYATRIPITYNESRLTKTKAPPSSYVPLAWQSSRHERGENPSVVGKKDERVLRAFLEHREAEGHKLDSDGKELRGRWIGGSGIATWHGDVIVAPDLGGKTALRIQAKLRRMAPRHQVFAHSAAHAKSATLARHEHGGNPRVAIPKPLKKRVDALVGRGRKRAT